MIDKNRLEQYAELKNRIKELQTSADTLADEILLNLQAEQQDEVTITGVGIITVASRRKWLYPQTIQDAEADLKQAKLEAEAKGEATYTENPYIIFKAEKPQ